MQPIYNYDHPNVFFQHAFCNNMIVIADVIVAREIK